MKIILIDGYLAENLVVEILVDEDDLDSINSVGKVEGRTDGGLKVIIKLDPDGQF